jgi:hypothetical protein
MALIPVVDMENYPSVYQEQTPVLGSRNVWEYYFQQPAGRSLDQLGKNPFVTDGTIPKGYPREIGHDKYRELWHRHARLNDHAASQIANTTIDLGITPRTLGVHFRGQEMRTAIGHKFPPTLGQMNDAIAHVLENYDFDEILLVTEAQQYVRSLRKKWGSRLAPSPTYRLWRQNSYRLTTEPRKWHRYRLGMEALQDAHLLAACGGFIAGHSGLSEAALLITEKPFAPHIRISQGRNSFRPYLAPWLWYSKALLPGSLGGFKKWAPESAPPAATISKG